MKIVLDRGDGTSFTGVSDGTITKEGDGTTGALMSFPGYGWSFASGTGTKIKGAGVTASATGSEILLQTFPPAPSDRFSKTRVLLVQSSGGGGNVVALDNSDQRSLSVNQYIDVINSNPVQIGNPQTYVPSTMPETATALEDAEEAMEQEPES